MDSTNYQNNKNEVILNTIDDNEDDDEFNVDETNEEEDEEEDEEEEEEQEVGDEDGVERYIIINNDLNSLSMNNIINIEDNHTWNLL